MATIGPVSIRRVLRSRRSLAIRPRRRDTARPNRLERSPNSPSRTLEDRAMTSRSVVIAEPVRTAIGAFGGTLKDVPAADLGAVAIRAAGERAGLRPHQIETAALGNVTQARPKSKP